MPYLAESVVEVLNKILNAVIIAAAAVAVVVTIEVTKAIKEAPETTVCEVSTTTETETATTVPATTGPAFEPTQAPAEATQPTTLATEPPETTLAETEPPVTLYDVPLETDLQLHIISEAEAHDIDPAIVFAMAYRESSYNADCIGDSGSSLGLLQVQPRWHEERMERLDCKYLMDPYQNVTVAVDYLHELLGIYGSIDAALVAYNRGHFSGIVTEYARAVLAIAEELRGTTYESYLPQTGHQS